MSLKAPLFSLALLAAVVGVFTPAAVAQADGFTCRASALRVTSPALTAEPVVANAANNPCADDSDQLASGGGPVTAATFLRAATDAEPSFGASMASVAELATGGIADVRASTLSSNARVTCTHGFPPFHPGKPTFSGSSTVAGLTVGGVSVTVTGQPNQTVTPVPGLTIVINEQIVQPDRITVRALRVSIAPFMTEVVVAESIADVSGHHPCA